MRAIFTVMLMFPVTLVAATPAGSEEAAAADPAAASASSAEKADADEEFQVPPGFRLRTRGKYTLYCREESVMGTRFPSVKCYDEDGVREILRAQRDDQQKVDQMRRICGSLEACGS